MNNFSFRNPTKIHFGKGQIAKIKEEIPADARVLITYGGGSIKKMGFWIRCMLPYKTSLFLNLVVLNQIRILKH